MRTRKLDPLQVVALYTIQHLTCEEIGKLFGVSRSAVHRCLQRAGVAREQGTWVDRHCGYCGQDIKVKRALARKAAQSYCGPECYYASLEKGYLPWRQGCRIARAIVAQHFHLAPEHVVHHKDGNNRNNDRANLLVFASQADHMAHHRGRIVQPLWDGLA